MDDLLFYLMNSVIFILFFQLSPIWKNYILICAHFSLGIIDVSEKPYFSCQPLESNMSSLVLRAATIKDISSIVEIRQETLTDEEIDGFFAPEFATFPRQ